MLIKQQTLQEIVDGRVTLQFRRWKRPTVKPGGTLLTAAGQLAIESLDVVSPNDVSDDDARAAGFPDRAALFHMIDCRGSDAPIYRVALSFAGPDPRIQLSRNVPEGEELETIVQGLHGLDDASPVGAWTTATLQAIAESPGVRAADLAERVGVEKDRFKRNVRKLKSRGLTESLEVGYRLSPRGEAVLAALGES